MATAANWHATDMAADDVLTAVFALAREGSNSQQQLTFRGHDSSLQRMFWKLKRTCRNRFLKPFVFSNRGPEPYSPVLSESISRLQLSGFVGRDNPDYEVMLVKPAAEDYFNRELRIHLSTEDVEELRRIARRFLRIIRATA